MLLHLFLLCVVAIWMMKAAEQIQMGKSKCVLFGVIGYIVFAVGIHYSLIIFGEEFYENHRLIFLINILSGFLGVIVVNLILNRRGKKLKKLKEQ